MSRVILTSSVDVDGTPAELWPLLTDTERMNRTLRMREVRYEPVDPARRASRTDDVARTAARFVAHTRLGGMSVVYEEEPFEFVAPERYSVRRRMRGGLIAELVTRLQIATAPPSPSGEGRTRVTYTLEVEPRVGLLAPVFRLSARQSMDAMIADARGASRRRAGHVGPVEPPPVLEMHRLDRALGALREAGAVAAHVDRLRELIVSGHDAELVAVRPYELASAWNVEPRELLRTLLHSVKAGLFELRWSLVCPSCRTFSEQLRGLDEVPPEGHCQLCDISYELDVDRAVEATFVVHPGVRRVNDATFCIGGPGRTPHVLAQANLAASGGAVDFVAPSGADRYRIFARGGAAVRLVVDADAPGSARATAGESSFDTDEIRVAPGGAVHIVNDSGDARHVKLEKLVYASQAATASVLATLEDFRRLFSADLLKRGTPLKVARVAMFFSDLTGSTALYSQIGDASAFRMVDDHFDLLRAIIVAHEGVIVKTMGDAVMAAFHEERKCVAAAVESLRRFEAFRAEREHGDAVGLKLGMYAGPCYVVTANGALDYFGQTVNVTSRIQHLADSGELVLEASELSALPETDRAKVREVERFDARVKGVDSPLHLVRLRLASAD